MRETKDGSRIPVQLEAPRVRARAPSARGSAPPAAGARKSERKGRVHRGARHCPMGASVPVTAAVLRLGVAGFRAVSLQQPHSRAPMRTGPVPIAVALPASSTRMADVAWQALTRTRPLPLAAAAALCCPQTLRRNGLHVPPLLLANARVARHGGTQNVPYLPKDIETERRGWLFQAGPQEGRIPARHLRSSTIHGPRSCFSTPEHALSRYTWV